MIYFVRLLESLNVFQQAHYHNNYLKWAIKHYLKRYLFLCLCIVLCLINRHFILLGFVYVFIPIIKYKKRIVFTKRMVRLIVTNIIITVPFCFNFFLFYTYILFIDFVVILANYINKPLEKKIYNKYKRKAKRILNDFTGIKVAIGGSYGKTSTKYFLSEVLAQSFYVSMTEQSFNTPMGISKSCKKLDMQDYFICEMGATKSNDIDELMDMVNPDITILTSIGNQHLKSFKSLENIRLEKQKMYRLLDYNKIAFVYYDTLDKPYSCNVITYGEEGMYHIENLVKNEFDVYYEDIFIGHFHSSVIGKHNINNILCVIAFCDFFDIPYDISMLENFPHRLSVQEYDTFTLIDDSFNSNIYGALNAIDCLEEYEYKYIITPGFVELGSLTDEHHQILSKYIVDKKVIPLIVGGNLKVEGGRYFQSFKEAFSYFCLEHKKGAVVLIENDLPDNYMG